ncbi:MFS general substrate transporter [Ceraceosorus guamensis]|uniref:MFS general substrate transporter n=1 Tax=Ceraceosorus guamensis TaxID=1522189 RepID=A0A316W815_9BASI|nr:MFS general substrate transporter [Ceraceosorus guamensis]PWN44193.1 MFS general substrate transporter [Ceraceosorus guamensis]
MSDDGKRADPSVEDGSFDPAPHAFATKEVASSDASNVDDVVYDAAEEKRLLRKIDWLLLPILTSLYLLSFLDRSNIGNAKIEGIVDDIRLRDYPTATSLFFVGYVVFEVPANLLLKRYSIDGPAAVLAIWTFLFGIVSMCQGFVRTTAEMYVVRLLLGATEAGLFPGIVWTFSFWYRRDERVLRVSLFFGAAAAAGSLGGILAFGLTRMDGLLGHHGWQYLFWIEGAFTALVGILAWFLIPKWPAHARALTQREREVIVHRLSRDSDATDTEKFEWSAVKLALKDPHVYLYALLFHGFAFPLYTYSLSLPSIIAGIDPTFKPWQSQLLTIPPYAFAFVYVITTAWVSQKYVKRRAPFIIGNGFLAILGYIVLITSPTVAGKYTATFIAAAGIYGANGLLLAWPSENVQGQLRRAVSLAFQISGGNCASIIGTQLYRIPLGTIPNKSYRISHIFTIIWLLFGISAASALWILLARHNRRLDERIAERRARGQVVDESKAWREEWRYQT